MANVARRRSFFTKRGGQTIVPARREARKAVATTEAKLAALEKGLFRDCSDCPEMIVVPAGKFTMGSIDGDAEEKPVHEVTIPHPFAVGKYEVTFAEWEACAAGGGCADNNSPRDGGWGKGQRPVV
jgi:formylglycine-generating enzyme required for sulfatase activity